MMAQMDADATEVALRRYKEERAQEGEKIDTPEEMAAKIEWLRSSGVEVDLPEERGLKGQAATPSGPPFSYVHLPADINSPVVEISARSGESGDVLKGLLAPVFATEESMDPETVARAAAVQMQRLVVGGSIAEGKKLEMPSADVISQNALGGVCETYPLVNASQDNGWIAVRLYIDEVGALRARPRNKRAEDLASAVGLTGLAIHGDAFIGRCARDGMGREMNQNFRVGDLAHNSDWVSQARMAHMRRAAEEGHGDTEHLASGSDAAGRYTWTQTDEDVEVRVHGAPNGRGAAKRVAVSYGGGGSLRVKVDGVELLAVDKLFARVTPDDCSWSLDGDHVVVTLEKADPAAWAALEPLGSA